MGPAPQDAVPVPILQALLGCTRLSSKQRQYLPCDIAGICLRSEKDVRRRDFFRLGGASQGRLLAELRYVLRRPVGWIERSPNGTGRNAIHTDAFGNKVAGEGLAKGVDGSLGRRVIQQLLASFQPSDGTRVDDRAAWFQVRQRRLGYREVTVDVGFEGAIPLLKRYFLQPFLVLMESRVVDENVQLAVRLDRPVDRVLTEARLAYVAGQ